MNRIRTLFKKPGEKLIPFFTAGFPTLEATTDLVLAAEDGGADMIELGIPFSDPLADGPIIQASSQVALKNGVTIKWILDQVQTIRKKSEIPIALMGYINPILNYGPEVFVSDCQRAGVDGLIIPDLPPEEAAELVSLCRTKSISPILLIAPNTTDRRTRTISELAGDLVYCVSILGITGDNLAKEDTLRSYFTRVRENCAIPFVAGFGIKTRKDVENINRMSDGAVVGSALIQKLTESGNVTRTAFNYVRELKGIK